MTMIKMDTEDLKSLLDETKNYKHAIVYDSEINTDGEGVWHCDVELTDDLDNTYYDTSEKVWSFDKADKYAEEDLQCALEDMAWYVKEQFDDTPVIFRNGQVQAKFCKLVEEYRSA